RQALATTEPRKPSFMERLAPYLPSPRTALQVGGATIGGAIGTLGGGPMGTLAGGAAGATLGESIHQQMHPPKTVSEALSGIGEAASGGALQEGMGELLPRVGNIIGSRLYRTSLKPSRTLTPEEAAAVTRTLYKGHIPISESGMAKARGNVA